MHAQFPLEILDIVFYELFVLADTGSCVHAYSQRRLLEEVHTFFHVKVNSDPVGEVLALFAPEKSGHYFNEHFIWWSAGGSMLHFSDSVQLDVESQLSGEWSLDDQQLSMTEGSGMLESPGVCSGTGCMPINPQLVLTCTFAE